MTAQGSSTERERRASGLGDWGRRGEEQAMRSPLLLRGTCGSEP